MEIRQHNDLPVSLCHPTHVTSLAPVPTTTKPQRKNAKVRTGCFTCKTRRVKCDEAKPHCNRCIKFGTDCDGYPTITAGRIRPLMPKKHPGSPLYQITQISSLRFQSQQEAHYFSLFCEDTAPQITGPFESSLWERLIPQASEASPFIRHAVIAIAALARVNAHGHGRLLQNKNPGVKEKEQVESGHRYALKQYDIALRLMRRSISRGEQDLRNALIACLLSFSFETLQGRQGPACALAESGLNLFYQWMKGCFLNYSGTLSSPVLEADLMSAFTSLDIHVVFFLDRRPLLLHQKIIDDTAPMIANMPTQFTTLQESRFFWQKIMSRNFHFKAKAQLLGGAAELGPAKQDSLWTESADFGAGEVPFSKIKEPSPELNAECQGYISDIYRWTEASSSIFASFPKSDRSSFLITTIMQIQAHMNVITLAGISFTSEMSFDDLLPRFGVITELSVLIWDQLVSNLQNTALYQFELGILPALFLVGSRCRKRCIRTKAINLLYSSPYREGIWDSLAVASISNWIRSVEEAEGEPGEDYIPEERRVFLTSADVDLYHRRAMLYCTQRKGAEGENLIFHESLVHW